jgi:hypothetical protein
MKHLMIFLLSCSAAFAKSQPQVAVVVNAPVDAVKANTVQLATADGYTIDHEGQFQIVFAKNISGKAGFMTNMLLAPSTCSGISPRYVMTVMFVPGQEGITLRPVMEYEYAGPLCRPVRSNMDGKNFHQNMEVFSQAVKAKSEQANTAPSPEIQKALVGAKENTVAAGFSPAAAASLAAEGHVLTREEIAQAIKEGRASRCAIITYPPGAEVFIDGNKLGVTPVVTNLMKRDAPRTVTVKLPGYKTFEKQFEPDGKPIPLGLTLEKE